MLQYDYLALFRQPSVGDVGIRIMGVSLNVELVFWCVSQPIYQRKKTCC